MRKLHLLIVTMVSCAPIGSKAQSNYLIIPDTRSAATAPGDYVRSLKSDFKMGTSVGLPDATYHTVVGLRGWSDDSGGPAHELAFSNSKGIYYRTGTQAAGWGVWRKMLVENVNGYVGIGTNTPVAKLTVNGNILANEIKIKTDITVPDYVFDPSYQLPTLASIEEYVKRHKHLPEIPSAAEIQKAGVDLTQMNLALLKKVEELTLHLISKEKEIEKLKENQKNSLQKFSERLEKLENEKMDK